MFAENTIFCQPSWVMESSMVRIAVTHLGGHMGPVQFCGEDKLPVEPYYVSHWQCEENTVPAGQSEKVLRGDFFCLPFGYAGPGSGCPSHGKTAGGKWSLEGCQSLNGVHELRISMQEVLGSASVVRQYFLRDGESVVYDRTIVTGLSGRQTLGHHAVLRVPSAPSSFLISTGQQVFGMTYPKKFSELDSEASQSLAIGGEFHDLRYVPLPEAGETTDLSLYPTERESTDLVQIATSAEEGQPGWTTAVNTEEGYLWFSLRDVAVLPSTLMWIENQARKFSPWDGRSRVLGLEDVCSFFDLGSAVSSIDNAFSRRGIKTAHEFESAVPFVVSYIQGATRVPAGFGRVCAVECLKGSATFADATGAKVSVALDTEFLFGKDFG